MKLGFGVFVALLILNPNPLAAGVLYENSNGPTYDPDYDQSADPVAVRMLETAEDNQRQGQTLTDQSNADPENQKKKAAATEQKKKADRLFKAWNQYVSCRMGVKTQSCWDI
jgi:hypothetical protein